MKQLYSALLLLSLLGLAPAALAQVGVGTTTPDAAAALDVQATGKGLLIPRMDSATRAQIASPPTGLLVFQTDGRQGFWYSVGGSWVFIPDKTRSGDNLGNHTATQNLNLTGHLLVGGTAAAPGTSGVFVAADGKVGLGIGTTTPYSRLASTSANIVGSDGQGGNGNSLAWGTGQSGYVGMFYNSVNSNAANGLAVKVASNLNTTGALDVSQNTSQTIAGTNLFRVTGAGNVGIGATTPNTRLSISPTTNEAKLTLWDGGSTTDHLGFGVSSSQLNYHVAGTSNNHIFYAGGKNGNGTELVRITGTGRLGIGLTGTPSGRFQLITSTSGSDDDYLFDQYGPSGDQAIYFRRAGGTPAAPTDLVGGEQLGAVSFGGRFGGTQGYSNSYIRSFYRGNGTTGFTDLRFATTGAERMRIDSAGFVGIGTAAPVSRLSFPNTSEAKITLYGNATNHYGFGISASQLNYHVDATSSSHAFYAGGRNGNGTELLRITGTGRLGLATTGTPAGRLQLLNDNGGSGTNDDYLIDEYGPSGDQALYFRRALGTAAAPADLAGGEQLGAIGFGARFNGTQGYINSYVRSYYRGNGTTGATDLRFGTSTAERMRIDSAGFVGIGTTNPLKRLHVNANSDFLRVDNLASVSNTNNYLVIDGSGNVGKTTVENVAGQLIRLGFNGTNYFENTGNPASAEAALRFNSHASAASMGNAPNGAANFINTITGASIATTQAVAAGNGTPARITDQITLPAGVYRVTVRLCGNYYASGASGTVRSGFVKFIVNNNEYSLVETLNASDYGTTTHAEVSDYLNLSATSTVDFSVRFLRNFTLLDRLSPGTGNSYRSLLLIERVR